MPPNPCPSKLHRRPYSCSICVSGVCVTASELNTEEKTFKVGLAPETLRRTYFESLNPGDKVNLERASQIGGRNSGHFVQGHVDGHGKVANKWKDDNSLFFQIQVPPGDVLNYIVPKGFVAIDGTSLTVCEVNKEECWFTFMLVDYTQKKIILPEKEIGDKVNIEVDVLGKYSDSAMKALVPRLEMLESQYEILQSKAHELDAMNQALLHKVSSLESARLLEQGTMNFIPEARLVTGPEAATINAEWLRQQSAHHSQRFQKDHIGRVVEPEPAAPIRDPARPGGNKQQQEKVTRIKGPEAARINNQWRQQQEQLRDQYKVRRISEDNLPFAGVYDRQASENVRKRVVGGPDARRIQDEWLRSQGKTMFERETLKPSNIQDATIIDVGGRDPYMGMTPDQDQLSSDALRREFEDIFVPEERPGKDPRFNAQDATVISNGVKHQGTKQAVPLRDALRREFEDMFVPEERPGKDPRFYAQDATSISNGVKHQGTKQAVPLRDAKVIDDATWNKQPNQYNDLPHAKNMDIQRWNRPRGPHENSNQHIGLQDRRLLKRPPPENFATGQQPPPGTFVRNPQPPPASFARETQPQPDYFAQPPPNNFARGPQPPPPHFGRGQPPPFFEAMGGFVDPWYDQYDQSGRPPDVGGPDLFGPDDFRQATRQTKEVVVGLEPDRGLHGRHVGDSDIPRTRAVYHDQWPPTLGIPPDNN
jgi:riboflavin synthase